MGKEEGDEVQMELINEK